MGSVCERSRVRHGAEIEALKARIAAGDVPRNGLARGLARGQAMPDSERPVDLPPLPIDPLSPEVWRARSRLLTLLLSRVA